MTSADKQRDLIFYLLDNDSYVTSNEIADTLNISTKTVYRIISKINKESNKQVIYSHRGLGYKVMNVDMLRSMSNSEKDMQSISPVERRNRVLKRLLLSSPRFIQEESLWEEYYVGDSVRTLDKKVMRTILLKFNLKLETTNNGYKITGNELSIRNALKDLVNDKNIVDLTQIVDNKNFKQKYDVNFVTRQIEFIEDRLGIKIPYPYNINLFTHLYILLSRYRESKTALKKIIVKRNIETDDQLLNISKEVIQNISIYLGINIDNKEIYYVYEYLSSSSFNGQNILKTEPDDEVINITKSLVSEVYRRLGVKNYDHEIISDKLEKHIRPLLNRLKNNIKINNNLLEQIKLEYGDILDAVAKGTSVIQQEYHLNNIDENEAGYITLYFAQDIEENRRKVNALIMCATGIGTSQLLKTKVHNSFPEIKIVDVIGTNELNGLDISKVDLIISTIVPNKPVKVPIVLVSSLFTEKDKSLLHKRIKEIIN
ncbi:BglG family transcription antiterminator [Companilactobacillus kimchiensis]|nr:PRD domain-containing protein [Companilactobacillus kimchiensis]